MKKYILLLCAVFFLAGCALNRDVLYLEDRIFVLERSAKEQKKTRNKLDKNHQETEKGYRSKYAGLKLTVNQLREEINSMSGRFEEIDYYIKHQKGAARDLAGSIQQLDESVKTLTERLVRLEQYMGFEPSNKFNAALKSKAPEGKALSEKELYALAKETLDKGKTKVAREGFQTFLKKYPKSDNADNAQFWIGEIYYREKWYEKAILEYQKVIEKYPKGNKVPAAYLKQGFAFQNLGETANARLILKELISKFPKSKEATIAQKKIKVF